MNINDDKKLIIENELLPDLGIMMSYGTGLDLVSMGIFFVGGYYDSTGKKLDYLPQDKKDVEVEFIEYELKENMKVTKKQNGMSVRIPYNKARMLYDSVSGVNYDKVYELSEKKYDGRKLVALFDKVLSDIYVDYSDTIQNGVLGFNSKTLEMLEGSFFSSDGKDMGIDFRVFPFLYDEIRYKYLEKNLNYKDKFDKYDMYNYIYLLNYENENQKKKEDKTNDGGIIYEPSPRDIEIPTRYYENETEREIHIR